MLLIKMKFCFVVVVSQSQARQKNVIHLRAVALLTYQKEKD